MDRPVARSAAETLRNLALQIPFSFGPFNSLSIPGKALESAAYLAVGLHGWYKTRETTNSLLSVIKMQHPDNEILSNSHFEPSIFQEVETKHPFHGAIISDEENGARALRGLELDGQITRGEDRHKAILCWRALTSGLLCLFAPRDIIDILFNIMQKCLIHFHQPDMQFERQGPFSRALKDWIDAERTRESFRQKSPKLMKELDAATLAMSNIGVEDLQGTQFFETEFIIAFLQWLFAEEYKHDPVIKRDYPTRSFHVWSLAFILGRLDFLVEASTIPIHDHQMWEDQVCESLDTNHLWRVHLVTSNAVFADLSYDHRQCRRMDFRERRLIPIGSIPTIAFDYFRCYDTPDLDTNFLNEIFIYTFSDVTAQLPKYTHLQALADLRGETSPQQLPPKVEDWVERPGILQLLQRSVHKYIPKACPDDCGKARCHYPAIPFDDSDGNSEESNHWRTEVRKDHNLMSPWIKVHIIMLAFAYAVACQFVVGDDGKRADLDTEVCWTPMRFFENRDDWKKVRLIIPDGDLKTWVRTMSDALNFQLEPLDEVPTEKWPRHRRLKKALFHMICGHKSEIVPRGADYPDLIKENTLGCCANGLTLVSKILVNPSANASDLHLYYIRFGRILELPVSSDKLIEACDGVKRPKYVSKFDPSSQPRVWDTTLRNENTVFNDVRWDPNQIGPLITRKLVCAVGSTACPVASSVLGGWLDAVV